MTTFRTITARECARLIGQLNHGERRGILAAIAAECLEMGYAIPADQPQPLDDVLTDQEALIRKPKA